MKTDVLFLGVMAVLLPVAVCGCTKSDAAIPAPGLPTAAAGDVPGVPTPADSPRPLPIVTRTAAVERRAQVAPASVVPTGHVPPPAAEPGTEHPSTSELSDSKPTAGSVRVPTEAELKWLLARLPTYQKTPVSAPTDPDQTRSK